MPDNTRDQALAAFVAERQRAAITTDGRGGYSVDHLDPATIVAAFNAQYVPPEA